MRYRFLLFLFLVYGCIPTYRLSRPSLIYNYTEGVKPELNKEVTADSGSAMYSEFKYKINPAVELNENLTSKYRDVQANVKLAKMNKDGNQVYGTISISDQSITYLRDKDNDGKFDDILVQARKNSTNWAPINPEVSYRQVKGIRSETDGYQLEVIYRGLKEDSLALGYREYRNDLTRASSTQKMNYKLDDKTKNILKVNGARIQVIHATSGEIKYKILRGFDN